MTDLLFKAKKYMNGEGALTVKGMDGKKKINDIDEPRHKKKEKKDCSPNQNKEKGSSSLLKKMVNFTPLNMPVVKVLLQIKDNLKDNLIDEIKRSITVSTKITTILLKSVEI